MATNSIQKSKSNMFVCENCNRYGLKMYQECPTCHSRARHYLLEERITKLKKKENESY